MRTMAKDNGAYERYEKLRAKADDAAAKAREAAAGIDVDGLDDQLEGLRAQQAELTREAEELRDRRRQLKDEIDELVLKRQAYIDATQLQGGAPVAVEAQPAEAGVERG